MKTIKMIATLTLVIGLATSSLAALPNGWYSDDIGETTTPGSASYNSSTNLWTVSGNGNGLGLNRSFYYVYTNLKGDGQITARVISFDGPTTGTFRSRAGVMIQDELTSQASYISMAMDRDPEGMDYRGKWMNPGIGWEGVGGGSPKNLPYWFRIKRTGDYFAVYYSSDGVSWATHEHWGHEIPMETDVYIGLFVTSAESGVLNTATFDNVTIEGNFNGGTPGPDNDWIVLGSNMYSAVSGNVGIGTSNPSQKLHVAGTIYSSSGGFKFPDGSVQTSAASGGSGGSDNLGNHTATQNIKLNGKWLSGDGGNEGVYVTNAGNVGVGKTNPQAKLDVVGKIRISNSSGGTVMELGEGLDYAEGFNISNEDMINPGSVLVIDPNNPGKLTLSTRSYDKKVAGIVAGAKGLGSGVRLGTGQFDCDVALAGRVYCNVDATKVAIEPGDLLTTSAMPGYAAKVVDYTRAQGAILGKAMEKLEKGKKGQMLVLVTLQ